MRNVKLWIWPGLAAVACVSALATWFTASAIEADIRSRTLAALRVDHAWAQVLAEGRDLTLTGLAPDEGSRGEALAIAGAIYGVRAVGDASALLPEESPYRFSAVKTPNGIMLSGFVPTESARAAIISKLTDLLPGIALSDQMKLARGAPEGLVSLAGYGLAAFPRFSTGSLEITDSTLQISGQALNPDDHEIALEALASPAPSAGVVSNVEIVPAPAVGDYTWSASKSADGIALTGYAPNVESRRAITESARSASEDLAVDDRMRYAAGVPEGVDWLAATGSGLAALANMTAGTVTLSGKTLNVSGEARDAEAFRKIRDSITTGMRGGVVLGTADIGMARAPTAEWQARLNADGLELSGLVSDEAVRDKMIEAARLKFGTRKIVDNLVIEAGASSPGFEQAALVALQALSRLENAEASIADGVVAIHGAAFNETSVAAINRLMAHELPQGFASQLAIAPGPEAGPQLSAKACQTELNRLATLNTVLFETGDAAIQEHSHGFLDRIAYAAQKCGQIRLEVSGHTDSNGSGPENLALSERRAQAVVDFMRDAGVSADRLVAIGYGESRPLQGNDTDAGKAANRRIEFRVLN